MPIATHTANEYWVVCIPEGLAGWVIASCEKDAALKGFAMLSVIRSMGIINYEPEELIVYPVGPFKLDIGDA